MYTETQLALIELKKDPLFHKIPQSRINKLVELSILEGKRVAELYQGNEIIDLYKKNNILIEYNYQNSSLMNYQLRAEYIKKSSTSKVILHMKTLNDIKNKWYEELQLDFTIEHIINMHLAHEFFHYHEYQDEVPFYRTLEPVVTFEIPIIKIQKKSYINQLSEIAAHSFTKALLGLDYFPTYLDYASMISSGEISSDELIKLINERNVLE